MFIGNDEKTRYILPKQCAVKHIAKKKMKNKQNRLLKRLYGEV